MRETFQAAIYSVVDGVTYLVFSNGAYGVLSNMEGVDYYPGQYIEVEWTGQMYGEYYLYSVAVTAGGQEEELRRQQEEELRRQQEEELRRRQEEELRRQQEEELRRQQEEELRRRQEEELRRQQEEDLCRRQEEELRRQQEEELRLQQEAEKNAQNCTVGQIDLEESKTFLREFFVQNGTLDKDMEFFRPDSRSVDKDDPENSAGGEKGNSFGGWADKGVRHEIPFILFNEIGASMEQHHSRMDNIRQQNDSNVERNKENRSKRMQELTNEKTGYYFQQKDLIGRISKFTTDHVRRYKMIGECLNDALKQIKDFGGKISIPYDVFGNVNNVISNSVKAREDDQREVIIQINDEFNEGVAILEQKKKEAQDELDQIEKNTEIQYLENIKMEEEALERILRAGVSEADRNAYLSTVDASIVRADHYSNRNKIPEFFYFGKLCTDIIMRGDNDSSSFGKALYKIAPDIASIDGNRLRISFPYCQDYREGISLMVKYASGQNEKIKKMIMPLLLRLFMTFPSGKLEATMIDPLGSGSSFPDLVKLAGARSERVVDTKVWCEAADIDQAISTFRRKVDDQTQAYGEDIESRLVREEIKVLAIMDFPKGFGQKTLENLHSIVRNASQNGVIVLIWTDVNELEKLRKDNSSLVSEIEQQLFICTVRGDEKFVPQENENMFLEFDSMDDIIANKDNLIHCIANEIDNYQQKIEKFSDLFRDNMENDNNWFKGENDKISIPLGIKGANTVMKLEFGKGGGSTEHHALIAGRTGAGKTSLIHTLVVSAMLSYSPDDLQLYLVDFKEGVEFKQYTKYRIPNLRVVAVDSEREFGLFVLKKLEDELKSRSELFSRYGVSDILGYNAVAPTRIPRILLIFDEVHELFSKGNDAVSSECLVCIGKLASEGRAFGIHLILACQDFGNCPGLSTYFSHFAVRIVVKGDNKGAASILSSDNEGIETLQNRPTGSIIYNHGGGDRKANTFYQVSYLPEEERTKYLELLNAYYTQPVIAEQYKNYDQRTLLTNVEDDRFNRFNRLIQEGPGSIERLASSAGRYGVLLGQGFGKTSMLIKEFSMSEGDNLLIAGRNEKRAMSIFLFAMLSVLYDELSTSHDASNTLCYLLDQSDPELDIREDTVNLDYLVKEVPQIEKVDSRSIDRIVNHMYETVVEREQSMQRGEASAEEFEQLFLMIFGLNRIRVLRIAQLQGGEMSLVKKLEYVLLKGPTVGVNSVVWSEVGDLSSVFVGGYTDNLFLQRIAYGLSGAEMEMLVNEFDSSSLQESTAVYYDLRDTRKGQRFRPYNLPPKVWLEDLADVYAEITGR